MSDPATTEVQSVQTLRRRRREEGRIFWNGEDQLAVLDPPVVQRLEAANFADLTMFDDVADVVRGKTSAPFDWTRLRAAWTVQMRRLVDADGLRRLAGRMDAVMAAEAGRHQDLVWLAERISIEALVPALIDGLSPRAHRYVLEEVFSKVAWVLSDIDDHRIGRLHKPKMIALQVLAGLAVRRELKGRARGTRPRRQDLADPVIDLMPTLGLGRAVDAVTALLTAITGSPGAAAACLLFELHRQPLWRARLEAELSAVPLETLCAAPMRSAPVTARFVKEVLRIWSSPPVVIRRVRTDIDQDGIALKVGQSYMLSSFLMHHDERDWGDAETFDPDRWLAEGRDGECPRGTYVPFGWAPKSCIGANLGMAQLVLLAHLACTRYRIEVARPNRAHMAVASLARPKDFEGVLNRRDPGAGASGTVTAPTSADSVAAHAPETARAAARAACPHAAAILAADGAGRP